MSPKRTFTNKREINSRKPNLHLVPSPQKLNVVELFRPGSFARIDNHPNDLPPFQIIHCKGGRCLIRQQTWGQYIQWEVEHHRLKSA